LAVISACTFFFLFVVQGELTCEFSKPTVTQYDFLQQKLSKYICTSSVALVLWELSGIVQNKFVYNVQKF